MMDEPTVTPPPPPVGKARPPWLLPVIVGIVGLIIGVAIGQSTGDTTTPSTVAQESASPTGMSLAPPEPTEPPEPVYDTLTAKDLELTLKTIESSCYGSAGGLQTVRIRVGIDGTVADNLDPDVTWDVTYKLTGDENGPIVGTFSIYPDGQYDVNEENLATPTCATKPTIRITDVEGF
jgi:hypothetical protein